MWSIGTRAPPRSSWTRAQASSSPPRTATPSRCRARRAGAPVPLPVVGARPRLPLVAMELARRRDRETHRRALTLWPDVVEVVPRSEDEVASPRANGLGLPLDLPVDLALDDEPPLVHQVVVAIVGMTGRLADQGAHDLLVDHDLLRPGRRPFARLIASSRAWRVPARKSPLTVACTVVMARSLHVPASGNSVRVSLSYCTPTVHATTTLSTGAS